MSDITIAPKYRCPECDDLHDDRDDALYCCDPIIREIFVCPICQENFHTEEEAIDCCEWNGEERTLTAAELEAQGQMRLPSL